VLRLILPILIVAGLLVASVAWDRPTPRADLVTGYTSIETLDPQMTRAAADVRMGYALFEGLCTFDPDDFSIIPGVAKDWEVSEDQRIYTFHLRPDARWSDGEPVTAEDFRFAWRVGLMPDTAPPYVDFLFYIDGGREFFDWCSEELERVQQIEGRAARMEAARERVRESKRKFEELVGVEVVDRHTLRVELAEPKPYFREIAATWPLFPLPRHVVRERMEIQDSTLMLKRDPQWTHPGSLVGNGPYRLDEWRFKRNIRLEANEHYHAAESVGPASVNLMHFQDATAMFHGYESGTIDLLLGAGPIPFAPELVEAARRGERSDLHGFDAFGTYYYVFNTRDQELAGAPNPFADARVRRAFALATEKPPLVERVTRLHQTVTDVFIPAGGIEGYESPEGLGHDPERARKLLAEAGYPNGEGMPPIVMIYNTGGGHGNVAQALMEMWQEKLGVSIRLERQEWKTFLTRRSKGEDYHLARSGWFGD
jgi:oligopeptide transport system substrate-binding protein